MSNSHWVKKVEKNLPSPTDAPRVNGRLSLSVSLPFSPSPSRDKKWRDSIIKCSGDAKEYGDVGTKWMDWGLNSCEDLDVVFLSFP